MCGETYPVVKAASKMLGVSPFLRGGGVTKDLASSAQ